MSDTTKPTREDVQKAVALWDGILEDHPGSDVAYYTVLAAARAWLEGPQVDEAMIERAALKAGVALQGWDSEQELLEHWAEDPIFREDDLHAMRLVLRAALEVSDE